MLHYQISPMDQGKCLGLILAEAFQLSKRGITRLKRHPQGIMVNQRPATVRYIVQAGDRITIDLDDHITDQPLSMTAIAMTLDILYEDHDYLAVNKPANMPVHPSRIHGTDSLGNGVVHYLQQQGETTAVYRPITRLDKDTSGIVLIAKHAYAQSQLATVPMEKRYLALVQGHLWQDGVIEAPIQRLALNSIQRAVHPDGKYALTHYTIVDQGDNCTLVDVTLKTGRTHQIRVHFAHIGHPLLGDQLYGGDCSQWQRQALHAYGLAFIQPLTGIPVKIHCPFAQIAQYDQGLIRHQDHANDAATWPTP